MIKITSRQKQVLDLMKEGKGARKIANTLGRHLLTVYGHQKALRKKGIIGKGGNGERIPILKDARSYRVS